MFYLKNFFSAIFEQKVKGLAFVLLSLGLTFSLLQRNEVKNLFSFSQKIIQKPYFNALLPSASEAKMIVNRLEKLPGVEEVKIVKHNLDKNSFKSMGVSLSNDVVAGVLSQDYQTIKVVLENNLEMRSQNLIKEYLGRLLGDRDVTISEVKLPQKIELKKNDPSLWVDNYGDLYIIAVLGVLWLFSCYGIISYIQLKSYLVEKFQRKSDVAMKTFFVGVSLIFIPTIAYLVVGSAKLPLKELAVLVLFISFAILFAKKKVQFQKVI